MDEGKGQGIMLKPAALFSDGAVLCREKEIRVFGDTDSREPVTVKLFDAQNRLMAEGVSSGPRFCACLAPQKAATGCTLEFRSAGETVEVWNVVVGDVFLAGGQSNMELPLDGAEEGPDTVRTNDDPMLRWFTVPKYAVAGGQQQAAADAVRWERTEPGKGGNHSAVAAFFAAKVRKRHPEVPVGIIECFWGGTSITCWMDEDTLLTLAEGERYLREYRENSNGKTMETYLAEEAVFRENLDRWSAVVEQYKSAHPGASWPEITEACGPCPWNPPIGPGSPFRPGGLAESMVRQVIPAALSGILYYQGEEDAAKTVRYDELMILLIRSWRRLFRDPELPFLFVQLPMWLDFQAEDTFLWPALRLAQAAARDALRGVEMVCLLDKGEYGNIHPVEKRAVGERLAELAEIAVCGGKGERSPWAVRKYTHGNTVTVELSAPLAEVKPGVPLLCEVAGEDGSFRPAFAVSGGNTLRLWAKDVPAPVHARYAWTDYAGSVPFFGRNGLPLEPFCF